MSEKYLDRFCCTKCGARECQAGEPWCPSCKGQREFGYKCQNCFNFVRQGKGIATPYKPYCSASCDIEHGNKALHNGHQACNCPERIDVTAWADPPNRKRWVHGHCMSNKTRSADTNVTVTIESPTYSSTYEGLLSRLEVDGRSYEKILRFSLTNVERTAYKETKLPKKGETWYGQADKEFRSSVVKILLADDTHVGYTNGRDLGFTRTLDSFLNLYQPEKP